MTLRSIVSDTIDHLLLTYGEATPLGVAAEVMASHPDEVAEQADRLIQYSLRQTARDLLAGRAQQKQEVLPGLSLPATFTVSDGEGGYRYVSIDMATLGHERSDLGVKDHNLKACEVEYLEATRRHEALWSVEGANENMPVLEAIRLLGAP